MYGLLTVTVIVLVGVVAGENMCSIAAIASGFRVGPHPQFCDLFIQCQTPNISAVKRCGGGLFFDTVIKACNYPAVAHCYNNPDESRGLCTSGKYPTSCCDTYIDCDSGVKVLKKCPIGWVFSRTECVPDPNACRSHPSCPSDVRQISDPRCRKNAVDNKCEYDEYLSDDTPLRRKCADGTAYNATTCACTTRDTDCVPAPYLINKVMDPQCRPSFDTDFGDVVTSFTEKGVLPRQPNPYTIKATGYSSGGRFRRVIGKRSGLQIPHFAQNMIKGPFGIKITFRADANNQEFVLVGNGAMPECESTLEIKARNFNEDWTFTAKAVGNLTSTVSLTIQVYGDSDVTVLFIYDLENMWMRASAPSSGRVESGPQKVGGEIKNSPCNLEVVPNTDIILKEFIIYEACGNVGILNNM